MSALSIENNNRAALSTHSLLNYKPKVGGVTSLVKMQNFQIQATYNTAHGSKHKKDATFFKKRENDAMSTLNEFRLGAKTINAQLRRIVNSGDSSHHLLEDRRAEEYEVISGIGVLIKLRLKDKTPPCILSFRTGMKNQMFRVFYSTELREPTESSNHGSDINVSAEVLPSIALITSNLSFVPSTAKENSDCGPEAVGRWLRRRRQQPTKRLHARLPLHQSAVRVGWRVSGDCARELQARKRLAFEGCGQRLVRW